MTSNVLLIMLAVSAITFQTAKAQSPAATRDSSVTIAGKWNGTFEGSSSGKFELVINQDNNRKLTGQVIMLADDGNRYPINLKTISWENGQLKASYTADGDDVNFAGNYANTSLKGTWTSAGGQDSGTWQATR